MADSERQEYDTVRSSYHFKVTEYSDRTPWIMLEPRDGNLPILENGFLGLDCREGVTFEQAKKLAAMMNNLLGDVSYTFKVDKTGNR